MDNAVCPPGGKPSKLKPTLTGLSNEILTQIFQILLFESRKELFSFASVSRYIYQVFQSSKNFIFLSVLQQTIQPDILYHAIAAIKAPNITQRTGAKIVKEYLDDYFEQRLTLSRDFEETLALYQLCARTLKFIQDYAQLSIGLVFANDESPQHGSDETSITLSDTELARFQRGFFRFEIYTRCFGGKKVVYEDQISWFLGNFTCWEVEELSCVHHYLCRRTAELLDRVEQEMISFVLEASGKADISKDRTPQFLLPRRLMNDVTTFEDHMITFWNRREGGHGPNPYARPHSFETTRGGVRMEPRELDFWDCGPLWRYTQDARRSFLSCVSKQIAHPLKKLECLLVVNKPCSRKQIKLIKGKAPHPFLDGAIDELCRTVTKDSDQISTPNKDISKNYNIPNAGFRLAGLTQGHRRMLGDWLEVSQFFILRLMGYVFWDVERLDQPVPQGNLSKAARKEGWTGYYHELTGERRIIWGRLQPVCADHMIGDIELPATVRFEVLRRYGDLKMIAPPIDAMGNEINLTEDELLRRYVGLRPAGDT